MRLGNVTNQDIFLNEIYQYRFIKDGYNGPNSIAPTLACIIGVMAIVRNLPLDTAIPLVMLREWGDMEMVWSYCVVTVSQDGLHTYATLLGPAAARSPEAGLPIDVGLPNSAVVEHLPLDLMVSDRWTAIQSKTSVGS
jgi:hypothetical protein